MNDIQKRNPFVSGYSDIFTCMGFNDRETCRHSFDSHVLLYVYSGTLQLCDGMQTETIPAGGCAFIHKGEKMTLEISPDSDTECHVMRMVIPRAFLCELYHCQEYICDMKEDYGDETTGHKMPDDAATTSLFKSLVPFYEAGAEVPQSLYRLKLTEAVMALLSNIPESRKWLFDFAYTPMNLLDVVATAQPSPMKWEKVEDMIHVTLN